MSFDLLNLPLAGVHLIDASAGTGKTYTIAGLVLRLLLERDLSIREILVVTYTEAATEDLRGRVRARIREALTVCGGEGTEDEFLRKLLAGTDPDTARARLTEALRDFDEAAIFTIHGFCQRLLRENSLETGAPLAAELLADARPLLREIAEDYWRLHVYEGPPEWVEHAAGRTGPEELLGLLARHLHTPGLAVIPEARVDEAALAAAGERFRACFGAVQTGWPAAREAVAAILLEDPSLKRTTYKPASIPSWLAAMDGLCPEVALFDRFDRFTPDALAANVKKGGAPPAHPFFDRCGELLAAAQELEGLLAARLLSFRAGLFAYARKELAARKERQAVFCFDDLLQQVHRGLHGPAGRGLAREVRRRYPAALIDEFQDTDPVQYEIFSAVYPGGQPAGEADPERPESLLYLIGDPKQAIYGFRGADIFAYLRASREVTSRFGMDTNYRAAAGLVEAVNLLFARPADPFIFREIGFTPVAPAERPGEGLRLDGLDPEPFRFWFLARPPGEAKPLPKEEARARLLRATAAEIVRLLRAGRAGRATLNRRPLGAGDIAVLVRTNREARLVQEELAGCGVPAVLHGLESLFATREAEEMLRLLAAVAEPGDESRMRLALVTGFCGLDGGELAALLDDETGWEARLLRFREYHELWRDQGFIRMFRAVLRREGVRPRLLAFPDGERRLTNVLHLMEVLHQEATAGRLGMAGLCAFLAERLGAAAEPAEEHLLRLESDAERVRIVTIHKSKGLEYPVVFCPFCWQERKLESPFAFHAEGEGTATLDLGSPQADQHRQLAVRETLAENLRLLYVALTRARERCYVAWGAINGTEASAPAYLLHQDGTAPDRIGATALRVKGMEDAAMLADMDTLAAASGGAIGIDAITGGETPARWESAPGTGEELRCRVFAGSIAADWRVTSYSGLVHGGRLRQPELPDRDALPGPAADQGPGGTGLSIFDFPQGAGPGTFLHELLEHLDFAAADPGAREGLLREKLAAYGYDRVWTGPVLAMLGHVLETGLAPGLTLSRVTTAQRLNELEFYFPLASRGAAGLGRIFAGSGRPWAAAAAARASELSWPEMQGFCKGFVDLVFEFEGRYYLADWKSNFLGRQPDDYRRERLDRVMADELYILQYHLYVLALHRYLAARLPGYDYRRDFGGVFYLFLRGMDRRRGPACGVFSDVPDLTAIEKLEALLCP